MLTLPIWAFVLCVLAGPVTYAALDAWRTRRALARARMSRECEADKAAAAIRTFLAANRDAA